MVDEHNDVMTLLLRVAPRIRLALGHASARAGLDWNINSLTGK